MKAHLLYRDADFDPQVELSRRQEELIRDLDLDTLFGAMARGDSFLFEVSKKVILSSLDDPEAIIYRQQVLEDCIPHAHVIREMYAIAVEGVARERKLRSWGFFTKYPSAILCSSVEALEMFVGLLRRLRLIAEEHAGGFRSEGMSGLFAVLVRELDDEYLQSVDGHLERLKFKDGMLISARLGNGGKGADYMLRTPEKRQRQGLKERVGIGPRSSYAFDIHPRDDAGARALRELADRAGRGKLDRRLSGKLLPRDERSSGNGEETEEKPHGGLQGQGGAGGGQGGEDRGRDRRDLRRPPQPGHAVEKAAFGEGLRGLREGEAPGGGPQRA